MVKRPSHQFNQTRIRTRNGLGALVQSDEMKFGIRNFLLAISGWATSFDFRSHLVNEAIILFGSFYMMNTAPTDNKTPKGRFKRESHHEIENTLLAVLLRFGAF